MSFSNWHENLDKTSKIKKNRNSNLVIFGLTESKSVLTSEVEKYDVELFAKLIGELEILNKLIMSNNIKFQIDEIKRLNSKKETSGSSPLWIKLGGDKSQLIRNQILKAAKKLKVSIEFKDVSISPDLSVCQRKKLNKLKAIRNELNDDLAHLPYTTNYYYGIRNNKVTKLRKDIDEEVQFSQLEKKIKCIKNDFEQFKVIVNDNIKALTSAALNLRLIITDQIIGLIQKTNHQTRELINETVKINIVNSSAIKHMLKNQEKIDPISSIIQEILNGHIEAYTREKEKENLTKI